MVIFSTREYWQYILNHRPKGVKSASEQYVLNQKEKTHQYADKVFKEILSNKEEFEKFVKKYLKDKRLKILKAEEEKYCVNLVFNHSNKISKLLEQETIEEMLRKMEIGGELYMHFDDVFSAFLERKFKQWEKQGEKRGQAKGKEIGEEKGKEIGREIGRKNLLIQIVNTMLNENISEDTIMRLTSIDKEELEDIKLEIQGIKA